MNNVCTHELLLEQGGFVFWGIISWARKRRTVVDREANWFQCHHVSHVRQHAASATDSSTPSQVPF